MSKVDATLPQEQYDDMMDAVRSYLPAYLSGAARLRRGPVADVKALLQLDDGDVARLIGVHASLSEEAVAFVEAAPVGLRLPVMSETRERAVTQTVRGDVDWGATAGVRARTGNDRTRFAIRTPRKDLDSPENAIALWVFHRLRAKLQAAGGSAAPSANRHDFDKWPHRLNHMAATLARLAAEQRWLTQPEPSRPTAREIARLRTSRSSFHRRQVRRAAGALLRADQPGPDAIADLLCRTYFEPGRTWQLFELHVALSLVRAFDARLAPTERRLIAGIPGVPAFATYSHTNGDMTSLSYQGWPGGIDTSPREVIAKRHTLAISRTIPDIMIIRRNKKSQIIDAIVIEMKASHQRSYLVSGIAQLLAYLGEQPELFLHEPSAWLVAPESKAFADAPIVDGPLWIVSAEQVADAAVKRFAPAG